MKCCKNGKASDQFIIVKSTWFETIRWRNNEDAVIECKKMIGCDKLEVLFDVKHATVSEHISNILASGELDETSVGFSDRSTGGRKPKIYNLDMILSVGYRVNSKRGIAFRKWANNVLKQFILQGYAINEKRLQALKKTVDIQSRMLADALDIEEKV